MNAPALAPLAQAIKDMDIAAIQERLDNGDALDQATAIAEWANEGVFIPRTPAMSEQILATGRFLLAQGGEVDGRDEMGGTGLQAFLNVGFTDGVRMLLENGASPNAEDSDGWSCLATALRAHWETPFQDVKDCAELLLQYGADPRRKIVRSAAYLEDAMDEIYGPEEYSLDDYAQAMERSYAPDRNGMADWIAEKTSAANGPTAGTWRKPGP